MTDHLARAKDYIAIAENEDSKAEAYRRAAEEILAATTEDGYSQAQIAQELGRDRSWVTDLLAWHRAGGHPQTGPFGGEAKNAKTDRGKARKMLRDPEQRRQVIESLEPSEVETLVAEGTDRLVENARARRAEHRTEPTVKELMGGDHFNPAEHWADNLILRIHTNARALDKLLQRAGGVILGSLSPEEAFEYLQEAERQIAEARAAVQERLRDEAAVS